jgi:signal transduction histidine kinase
MSDAVRERLFQPYFSTKIGQGGTGLGSTIVDDLVRRTLGGSLTVDSVPGQGTQFRIVLPLDAPKEEHPKP